MEPASSFDTFLIINGWAKCLFSLSGPLSFLWVFRTGSASDWCALRESIYKLIDTIQYNTIPSSHSATVANELDHVSQWAETFNLKLNRKKTFEMVIRRSRGVHG